MINPKQYWMAAERFARQPRWICRCGQLQNGRRCQKCRTTRLEGRYIMTTIIHGLMRDGGMGQLSSNESIGKLMRQIGGAR